MLTCRGGSGCGSGSGGGSDSGSGSGSGLASLRRGGSLKKVKQEEKDA